MAAYRCALRTTVTASSGVWLTTALPFPTVISLLPIGDIELMRKISISFSIDFVQKCNNAGNSNDTWAGQLGIYHALTVAHSKTDSNKVHIHITYIRPITYYKAQRELKSEKSCKIDLFNCTPKRCEGTEINTVRKGIPAINHTFTEKICTQYFGA